MAETPWSKGRDTQRDQGVSTFGCLCLLIRVSPPLGVPAFWSGCFCHLISKWHWLQKPKSKLWQGVVSVFWSASDIDFKNLSLGVSTFSSGCLCLLIRYLCLLISKWHWLQKPKCQLLLGCLYLWSASDTDFKTKVWYLHLLIKVSPPLGVSALWSGCLCLLISKWHWLQKPKSQLWWGFVSVFWSASDTDFKNLSWVSLPFDQGVFACWSASDTDFKNLSLGVSAFWSASDTDFKNLSSNFYQGVVSTLEENTLCSSRGHSTKTITIPPMPPHAEVIITQDKLFLITRKQYAKRYPELDRIQ